MAKNIELGNAIKISAIYIFVLFHDAFDLRNALHYNMTVWILAGNYISFTIAAGLVRLHMPGVKKSRV